MDTLMSYTFYIVDLKVPRLFESYAKSISHIFSHNMGMDSTIKKENENEWIHRQLATEEGKYYEDTTNTSIPLSLACILFFVFFVLSSGFYCIIFLWKNPLNGFFFTGMLFTTIEDADTVSKKVRNTFLLSFVV